MPPVNQPWFVESGASHSSATTGSPSPRSFALKDPDENLGAQTLRGAAERTGDAVGDGTTTSTLLAQAILEPAVRAELRDRYPRDEAVGFTEGEIRGWFWVEVLKMR